MGAAIEGQDVITYNPENIMQIYYSDYGSLEMWAEYILCSLMMSYVELCFSNCVQKYEFIMFLMIPFSWGTLLDKAFTFDHNDLL